MQIGCPNMEDYSPCTCPMRDNLDYISFDINCYNVTTEEVKEIFEMTTPFDIQNLDLKIHSSKVFITKDIFANRRITNIILHNFSNEKVILHIHQQAFHSFREFVKDFRIIFYNLRDLSFDFLSGFHYLYTLCIMDCNNVNISTLPPLPRLVDLYIIHCTGLNDWNELPQLVNGLYFLALNENGLNDVQINNILQWVQKSPSYNILTRLWLNSNALTRIPSQIKDFSRLLGIDLRNQQNPGFGKISAVSFPNSLETLELSFCNITDIEPNILIPGCYY